MSKRKADDSSIKNYNDYIFVIKRLMNPGDANVFGTVHGGVILQMMEETGAILATKYCNTSKREAGESSAIAALVRIERTTFLKPIHVGEVVEVTSQLMYTSQTSLLINTTVRSENIMKGETHITNFAKLWYVPISADTKHSVLPVFPMSYNDVTDKLNGHKLYQYQKEERRVSEAKESKEATSLIENLGAAEEHTVAYSKTQLIHLVNQNDVTLSGNCRGGVMLKMMDECAGITAAKHCTSVVATVSLNAANLRQRVLKGSVLTATANVVFTSDKSLEIQVDIDMELPWKPQDRKSRVANGSITFVSVDKLGKPLPVPQLKIKAESEKEAFEEGLQRYELAMKTRRPAARKTSFQQ